MQLSEAQERVLEALGEGYTLKAHRYLDGAKVYKMHALDGDEQIVSRTTVRHLQRQRLITSNFKFPAATYTLTPKGLALIADLRGARG